MNDKEMSLWMSALEEVSSVDDKEMLERLRHRDEGDRDAPDPPYEPTLREHRDDWEDSPIGEDFSSGNRRVVFTGSGGSCMGCLIFLIILGMLPLILTGTFFLGMGILVVIGVLAIVRRIF